MSEVDELEDVQFTSVGSVTLTFGISENWVWYRWLQRAPSIRAALYLQDLRWACGCTPSRREGNPSLYPVQLWIITSNESNCSDKRVRFEASTYASDALTGLWTGPLMSTISSPNHSLRTNIWNGSSESTGVSPRWIASSMLRHEFMWFSLSVSIRQNFCVGTSKDKFISHASIWAYGWNRFDFIYRRNK